MNNKRLIQEKKTFKCKRYENKMFQKIKHKIKKYQKLKTHKYYS